MRQVDNFTEISFSVDNLDRCVIRTAIFDALKENLPNLKGSLLDIGCGKMPYREFILSHSGVVKYVGLDIESAIVYDKNVCPDYTWDGKAMPFENDSFDCAFGTEVLEHCPDPEVVLREVVRVLKPGGVFFFTVPFLWNLHEVPHDEYRYTPFSMERHLKKAGFTEVSIKATGGWHAAMAQMMGLWVNRSGLKPGRKKLLQILFRPCMNYLMRKDKITGYKFKEGQMITGLYGTAKK